MQIVNFPTFKVQPYEHNPRVHDNLIEPLTKMIQKYGFKVPILIQHDGRLIDGHGRLTVAKRLNMQTIPAIIVDDLTDDEIKALRIGVNEIATKADWDEIKLQDELSDLTTKFDFATIGDLTAFEEDLLEDLLVDEQEDSLVDGKGNVSILQYTNDVQFPTVGPLELPQLRNDMFYAGPSMKSWIGPDSEPSDRYLYLFSTDSAMGLDWSRTIVGFWVADLKLDRLWKDTATVTTQLKEKGICGVISPDFSIFNTTPLPLRLVAMYQALWCGRYFQEAGISIIVNVCASYREIDQFLAALPPHCPLARQVQGSLTKQEIEYEQIIMEHIAKFQPQRLILYTPPKMLPKFEKQLCELNVEVVTPRLYVRKEKMGF